MEDAVQPATLELRTGDASVSIDARRGGRLASVRVRDRELLLGPPDDEDAWLFWGCYLMAPWPGRLEHGVLEWRQSRYRLPQNFEGHAIHGFVFDLAWTVEAADATSASLACSLVPTTWPFGGLVRQDMRLEPDQLTCVAEIVADRPMPAALGWHPWFERGGSDPRVRLDATEVLETEALIPTGRVLPVDDVTDLRDGAPLGSRRLDHTYIGARSPAIVGWPDLQLRIELDPNVQAVVVHSPPRGFCVEPQTAWPNAFGPALAGRADTGARELAAGDSLRVEMVWRWSAPVMDR